MAGHGVRAAGAVRPSRGNSRRQSSAEYQGRFAGLACRTTHSGEGILAERGQLISPIQAGRGARKSQGTARVPTECARKGDRVPPRLQFGAGLCEIHQKSARLLPVRVAQGLAGSSAAAGRQRETRQGAEPYPRPEAPRSTPFPWLTQFDPANPHVINRAGNRRFVPHRSKPATPAPSCSKVSFFSR